MCLASPTLQCNYGVFHGFALTGCSDRSQQGRKITCRALWLSMSTWVAVDTYWSCNACFQKAAKQPDMSGCTRSRQGCTCCGFDLRTRACGREMGAVTVYNTK